MMQHPQRISYWSTFVSIYSFHVLCIIWPGIQAMDPFKLDHHTLCYISFSFSLDFAMATTPRSPSSPTSPTLASATPPPWFPMLKKSYTKNFLYAEDPGGCSQSNQQPMDSFSANWWSSFIVFLTMSNIKRSGDASMHCLQFLSFLDDDPRFLVFPLAMNDNLLMGDIKSDPNVNLCW